MKAGWRRRRSARTSCGLVAASGLWLALAALPATAQPAGELGGPEIGTAVRILGKVDWEWKSHDRSGRLREDDAGRTLRLHWTLTSRLRSALVMSFHVVEGVLLLGPLSEIYLEEPEASLAECRPALRCPSTCELRLRLGEQQACRLRIGTDDLKVTAGNTDFGLVAHRLYGTLVTVTEGTVTVEPVVGDRFELSAGELALVRGRRVWRGRAAAEEPAPPRTIDPAPITEPPLLPPGELFPRAPELRALPQR